MSQEIKKDIRLSIAKPLHAKWIVKFYDYIFNLRLKQPAMICLNNGITVNLKENIILDLLK